MMAHCVGFEPISRDDARALILGTLPGVESLRQQQYYAKKQNSFWKIMGALVGASPELPYADRANCLKDRGIALWDVCAFAERSGSLDSAIHSIQPNDFISFFEGHANIKLICFNGQPAEKQFRRYVMPVMPEWVLSLPCAILPSTSPANARMRFEQKLSRWRDVLSDVLGA